MAKVIHDAKLTTANARKALTKGVHWRRLGDGAHLGYRKGADAGRKGGAWTWRYYVGEGRYWQGPLGSADDFLEADDKDILSFDQAERHARAAIEKRRRDEAAKQEGLPVTVAEAVQTYLQKREKALGEARKKDARSRLKKHLLGDPKKKVLPDPLADVRLAHLAKSDLKAWRERVARGDLSSRTVIRLASDLKAALNAVAASSDRGLPVDFPLTVKGGLASPKGELKTESASLARADQILSVSDVRRLILAARAYDADNGWDGDLARLIIALAATGARFSQVAALKVGDLQDHEGKLMVPVSRKGNGPKAASHTKVAVPPDVIEALRPAAFGQPANAPFLQRWRHRQVAPKTWERDRRGAWQSASELARPWAGIVKRAGLSETLVPYCLRHSSIVRGLRANLPVRLVAALHDTSAAMIERHYSAFIVSALDELAASVTVPLAETDPGAAVIPLRSRA